MAWKLFAAPEGRPLKRWLGLTRLGSRRMWSSPSGGHGVAPAADAGAPDSRQVPIAELLLLLDPAADRRVGGPLRCGSLREATGASPLIGEAAFVLLLVRVQGCTLRAAARAGCAEPGSALGRRSYPPPPRLGPPSPSGHLLRTRASEDRWMVAPSCDE
jgi:hypothetical protein